MRSVIVISFGTRGGPEGRQTAFWCDARGTFGGGYRGAFAGKQEHEAVAFATREMIRYGVHRKPGAVLVAPATIHAAVCSAVECVA